MIDVQYASVCVLSFNRAALLKETLESLVSTADAPFELIIHDDGSSNADVEALLLEWSARGATVILNAPGHNQGVGTAINRTFKIASGDPMIKVDQDLIFEKGWLRDLQGILGENRANSGVEPIDIETPSRLRGEPRIGLMGLLHYHHEPVDSAKTMVADYGYWTERTHILGSGFAFTREAWELFGPFEEHSTAFAEDWVRMKEVEASGLMVNALPVPDLCRNVGMGLGPSTVNLVEGGQQPIRNAPALFGVGAFGAAEV